MSLQIIYKLEYNKAKPKGYTTIQDTPMLLHVRKVKDRISDVSQSSGAPKAHKIHFLTNVCNSYVTLPVKIITTLHHSGL